MSNSHTQRLDIQALRGFAVLVVVLYHAKIGNVLGGYLGVDIFFVISGYLITRVVATGIERGDFSLREFYFRRAKRLLPAALVILACSTALAPWFLNQLELRDFATQLVGALTFTANFVLWQQTGYFEGAGDLKPLLHIWSLAIEEQYYFLLPTFLLCTRPSRWLSWTIVLFVASFVLCLVGGVVKPIATFYLLPTRAWELLIGSVGALSVLHARKEQAYGVATVCRVLFIPALACLVVLVFFPFGGFHPRENALLVCLATIIIILRNSETLNASFPVKLLAPIGDISYSLYLVHWPIIAFLKNAWVGADAEIPLQLRLLTVALSFVFAYVLYRTVEDPLRKTKTALSVPLVAKTVAGSLLLAAVVPIVIAMKPPPMDFKEARQTNYGLAATCEYDSRFVAKPQCMTAGKPTLMVWGDSYAMHLVPGLARSWTSGGMIQATKSACGPFLGMALKNIVKPDEGIYKNQVWAEKCIEFNQSVLDYLRDSPSIRIVVLSSPFAEYLAGDNVEHVLQENGQLLTSASEPADVVAGLHRTARAIRALGRKVIVVAPPPSSNFDVGACLEREISGAVAIGGKPGCLIDRAEYEAKRAPVLSFLKSASHRESLGVISFDPLLCGPVSCRTMIDGTMIYRDSGHLSVEGSKLIAERMQLARLIEQQAR
jgi:peptidoglycan/LPS O-acetylase OafA/YrhL